MNAKAVKGFSCLYKSTSGNFFYSVQSKSKKTDGSYRRSFLNLETGDLDKAVREIRKRKLYQKFNNLSKREKTSRIKDLESSLKEFNFLKESKTKLEENLDLFCQRAFRKIKCIPDYDTLTLNLNLPDKTMAFSPRWIATNSDLTIIRKIRTFII